MVEGPTFKGEKVKVFCSECIYCEWWDTNDDKIHCNHPENLYKKKDNWFKRGGYSTKVRKNHPKKINKNNDCSWYKRRGGRVPSF